MLKGEELMSNSEWNHRAPESVSRMKFNRLIALALAAAFLGGAIGAAWLKAQAALERVGWVWGAKVMKASSVAIILGLTLILRPVTPVAFQIVQLLLDENDRVIKRSVVSLPLRTRGQAVEFVSNVVSRYERKGYSTEDHSWWARAANGDRVNYVIELI